MSIFKDAKKALQKMSGVSIGDGIPKFWLSSGCYVLNKILSGKYDRGIPQGRLTALVGPSGSGKSFVLGNLIKSAQKENFAIFIADTENALDYDYLRAIGVDVTDEDFMRVSLNEINTCTAALNTILKIYRDAQESGEEKKKMLICIDSLDFLFLNHALETYENGGELSNDQGLHAKKLKQLLTTLMQDIKDLPVAVVATKQVYVDQTPNAFPPFKMTESLKFPFSQIVLFSRFLERDKKTRDIDGIRLKAFGWKIRFTKPFQQVEMNVPYLTGLDPYDGVLQAAVSLGIVKQNTAWYEFNGNKFQSNRFAEYKEAILAAMMAREYETLNVEIDGIEEIPIETEADIKRKKLEALAFAEPGE